MARPPVSPGFRHLFSRSLGAAPGRLHLAAHSHHLWPDASFAGQVEAWDDAARLADRKWDRVMGEVWPETQAHAAAELGTGRPECIVVATNTHELLVRIAAAAPRRFGQALRVVTSSGEFHSARRQLRRWAESGEVRLEIIEVEPFDDFAERLIAAAAGEIDLILVSQVLFASGRVTSGLDQLARLSRPEGPWLVIDGYHSFMALPSPLGPELARTAFFLAGGYKYAMAGEGVGLCHAPPGFGERPPVTGWFADAAGGERDGNEVAYPADAMRFVGATFDPSGLYRFNAVRRMLAGEGLDTATISQRVAELQQQLLDGLAPTPLASAELLNPPAGSPHARFLAFRSPLARRWCESLARQGCVSDVRGDVLRIGLGLYHDADDVGAFTAMARKLETC